MSTTTPGRWHGMPELLDEPFEYDDDEVTHVYRGLDPGDPLTPGHLAICGYRFPGPARPATPVPGRGICPFCDNDR